MPRRALRLSMLVAAQLGLIALAACGDQSPVDTPPASSAYESGRAAPETPELAGAPPQASGQMDQGLAGGPRGLPPAAEAPLPATPPGMTTWRERDGRLVTAMAPIADPDEMERGLSGGPENARHAPRPRSVATARAAEPAPLRVSPPSAQKSLPAPITAKQAERPDLRNAGPALAPMQTPGARLTAALADQATTGAMLTIPDSLAKGEPGEVTLTLPDSLLNAIQSEAGKLDMSRRARTAEVSATLTGEGYEITPNGSQTAKLKAGEPTAFAWQVKPLAGEKAPLSAKINGALTGLRSPFDFALGGVTQPTTDLAADGAGLKAPKFGFLPGGALNVPGLGALPIKTLIGVLIVLAAIVALAILARRASEERERERARAAAIARERYRTMTSVAEGEAILRDETDPEPPPEKKGVSPVVVAAAAGAAAAAATHHHDKVEEAKAKAAESSAPQATEPAQPSEDQDNRPKPTPVN